MYHFELHNISLLGFNTVFWESLVVTTLVNNKLSKSSFISFSWKHGSKWKFSSFIFLCALFLLYFCSLFLFYFCSLFLLYFCSLFLFYFCVLYSASIWPSVVLPGGKEQQKSRPLKITAILVFFTFSLLSLSISPSYSNP